MALKDYAAMTLDQLCRSLLEFKRSNPAADKAACERLLATHAPHLTKARSVYVARDYSLRLSEANSGSFSNVVLSLSAIRRYDSNPFAVCVVRPNRLDFRLANTTFLKRISHSSQNLTIDKVRGSILGTDIMDDYQGLPNRLENFQTLFVAHRKVSWQENLTRLAEATDAIRSRTLPLAIGMDERAHILQAPEYAARAVSLASYRASERLLNDAIARRRDELLTAAGIDNVNLRGSALEHLITGAVNAHRLDDISFVLHPKGSLIVDIKTKLLDRSSAPKAYNIDKTLKLLTEPCTAFALFLIGLDPGARTVKGILVSIFDPLIVASTRIQHHWSGRGSRGTTQFSSGVSAVFRPDYVPSVDVPAGRALLLRLMDR